MTAKFSFIAVIAGAALLVVPAGWSQGSPDAFERAVAARQAQESTPIVSPDAFERAVAARQAQESTPIVSPDAVDRAVVARQAQESTPIVSPDAVDRAVAAQATTGRTLVFDDHRARQPVTTETAPLTSSSGGDLEWPQIGVGFAIGILLALGLLLAVRGHRIRPLPH